MSGLLNIQNIRCCVQLDIQRNNGANLFDETIHSERDHKTVPDLVSPAQKVASPAEFVAMTLRAMPVLSLLLVEPPMPNRSRVMTQTKSRYPRRPAGGWGVRLSSL